jgi:putative transposase
MRTSSCTGKHSEPTRSPDGSGVNREVHAPFCERPGVKFLRPTHPWAKTNMAPLRGWSLRGKRLKAKAPFGHWKTMTFLAALRHDRIDAPWVVDGPINGSSFRLYVEKILVPTLNKGDIVILDNLGSHKSNAVRAAIRAAGARLFFLPPYSPGLNPIEQVFASSNTFYARLQSAHGRRLGSGSVPRSIASRQMSAKPISQTQATVLPNRITL